MGRDNLSTVDKKDPLPFCLGGPKRGQLGQEFVGVSERRMEREKGRGERGKKEEGEDKEVQQEHKKRS